MMTPQWFEDDNGLYCFDIECPGIFNAKEEEADSIYHLFGNKLEWLMDCTFIKGTQSDKDLIEQNMAREFERTREELEHHKKVTLSATVDNELLRTELVAKDKVLSFGKEIIDIALQGGDADGGCIQELGVKHGSLLEDRYESAIHGEKGRREGIKPETN